MSHFLYHSSTGASNRENLLYLSWHYNIMSTIDNRKYYVLNQALQYINEYVITSHTQSCLSGMS